MQPIGGGDATPVNPPGTRDLGQQMLDNAKEVARLQARIRATYARAYTNPNLRWEWSQACADMPAAYNQLAFPGGYAGVPQRILAGDPETIETALCFLECRPYFFRSGYMFKVILKRMRRASLSASQAARLQVVLEKQIAWRKIRPPRKPPRPP